ncbi:hypothetical protein BT96DRAFT_950455 [Gymnopus androsaceus JB14]|uniref:Uncharacterized protein n=1 Tax=Gymnopus androsaceus JB14 TaxID=1447944 RepID=A0A6A4GGA4_9AGAR|nr:hypothetical protein BT96DRAFT_950455 [Gymnopus androsaceus JB14]
MLTFRQLTLTFRWPPLTLARLTLTKSWLIPTSADLKVTYNPGAIEVSQHWTKNLRTQLKTAKRIKPAVEQDSGRSKPMGERVDVVADKMHGKELLKKWAEDKDSFTFDTHLKDLFNVITSLGNKASLFTFQCFIYRRAY